VSRLLPLYSLIKQLDHGDLECRAGHNTPGHPARVAGYLQATNHPARTQPD